MNSAVCDIIKHFSLVGGDLTPDFIARVANRHQVVPSKLLAEIEGRFVIDLAFLREHLTQDLGAMRAPTLEFYAAQAKVACNSFNKTRDMINPAYVVLRYAGALQSNDLRLIALLNNVRMNLWSFDGSCTPSFAERECALLSVHAASEYVEHSYGIKTSVARCLLRCLYIVQCMMEGITPLPPVLQLRKKGKTARYRRGTLVRVAIPESAAASAEEVKVLTTPMN